MSDRGNRRVALAVLAMLRHDATTARKRSALLWEDDCFSVISPTRGAMVRWFAHVVGQGDRERGDGYLERYRRRVVEDVLDGIREGRFAHLDPTVVARVRKVYQAWLDHEEQEAA